MLGAFCGAIANYDLGLVATRSKRATGYGYTAGAVYISRGKRKIREELGGPPSKQRQAGKNGCGLGGRNTNSQGAGVGIWKY